MKRERGRLEKRRRVEDAINSSKNIFNYYQCKIVHQSLTNEFIFPLSYVKLSSIRCLFTIENSYLALITVSKIFLLYKHSVHNYRTKK